jgi:nicotinate-nucleotide adenylyltransferase
MYRTVMSTSAPSPQPGISRLGIFGGSFDPVHCGHLELARACYFQVGLDEVWFTPTAIQPLKRDGPHASDTQRIDMLKLAINDSASEPDRGQHRDAMVGQRFRICTLEIERGGYSYTVDTLGQIHEELPEAKLFFLMGADALRDVPNWKEPAEIFRLSTPLIVSRAGEPALELSALFPLCPGENQPQPIEMPPMDVSSSEIRRRVAAGHSLDGLVPNAVAEYIHAHGLYRQRCAT